MKFMSQKDKAIEIMEKLGIYKPYIDTFRKDNKVLIYDDGVGYDADFSPEIKAKIKELEEKDNVIVYAVTHEYSESWEFYDFLLVTEDPDEWRYMFSKGEDFYKVYAYCLNMTRAEYSEFGSVYVRNFYGIIERVG